MKYTQSGIDSDPLRCKIKKGLRVRIVLKKDQRTGKLTEGIVKDILTKSATHPHGIKVRLENGQVGRVKELIEQHTN
ncbi:MAG: YwbE family protein [Chloroflexi bacterium]|nr:YwbE family protein [Chloroflexota bacterium]